MITFYLRSISPAKLHGYFRFNTSNLNTIPIPDHIDNNKKNEIIKLVKKLKQILVSNSQDEIQIQKLILVINDLGYQIYQIDESSKKIIEESIKL